MRVLVMGGTGNISREIVRGLLERGHEVTIYNRGKHRDPPAVGVRVVHGDRRGSRGRDADPLEDQIIAELRRLPSSLSATGRTTLAECR